MGIPGSRPNRRHITTSPHMNEPRSTLDRQAAHIADEATMMNLGMIDCINVICGSPEKMSLTPQIPKVVVGERDGEASCVRHERLFVE